MPKFIGRVIMGAVQIENNSGGPGLVRLAYAQAVKLPPESVFCSLDTTDRGGKGSYAKRWYRWFATPEAILACEHSTLTMRGMAQLVSDYNAAQTLVNSPFNQGLALWGQS